MATAKEITSVFVDWADVGNATTREQVQSTFRYFGRTPSNEAGTWDSFVQERVAKAPQGMIVMTDLSKCVANFRKVRPQRWLAAVRSANPFIVAFVRNKQDEKHAAMVDDIVHASENRLIVCAIKRKSPLKPLQECIGRALAGIDPNSVVDARFAQDSRSLWLEFGDGKKVTIDWSKLDLDDVRPPLIPETAAPSEELDSIQFLRRNGSIYDIDSTAVRALVDRDLASQLQKAKKDVTTELGQRLREKRRSLGCTQTELAKKTGLDQSLISKMEQGKHQPRFATLSKYAKGLRLTVTELLS